jgi:hypothetical protein
MHSLLTRRNAIVASLLLIGGALSSTFAIDPPDTTGWKDLFAPDLSNAVNAEHWKWEDGTLVAKDHETLWTKENYGNYILDLEFKVSPEANSGVFIHSGNIKDTLATIEIQVHADTDGAQYGMVGAMYNLLPPSKKMEKPVGEWNRYTITCKDNMVTVVFNGEEVIHANLDDWKEVHKNPDGTPNKFKIAIKDFARVCPVGLQGLHGKAQAPVWYRNMKIKPLD